MSPCRVSVCIGSVSIDPECGFSARPDFGSAVAMIAFRSSTFYIRHVWHCSLEGPCRDCASKVECVADMDRKGCRHEVAPMVTRKTNLRFGHASYQIVDFRG